MTHRLFTLVAALSLLLCLATAVLWVRSYGAYEDFGYAWPAENSRGYELALRGVSGRIEVFIASPPLEPDENGWFHSRENTEQFTMWDWAWFHHRFEDPLMESWALGA